MNSNALIGPAAWTALGWTMLHLGWIGVAVGLVAAVLRRLLRRARPDLRHNVAAVCLLSLAAAPIVVFAWVHRPETAEVHPTWESPRAPLAGGTAVITAPAPLEPWTRGEPMLAATPVPVTARLEALVAYLPGVWLAGSPATLALVVAGLLGADRLRRSSVVLESGAIAGRCRVLAGSLGIAREIGVAVCDRIAAPVLIGVVRPMILLPPAALCGWSVEHLEMALLHELGHVRRHDNLVILLQRLAESLLFFHPVTWWLSAWVSLERELACDRLVVEHTGQPHVYARMLADLAQARAPGLALAMAEHPLTLRIRRILDMEDRSMRLRMTAAEGLGLIAALTVVATLTLSSHAGPPRPSPDETRRTLRRLEQDVLALPDGTEYDAKGQALIGIARAHLKLGDRAAALATLDHLEDPTLPGSMKPGPQFDRHPWSRFANFVESAACRRDCGDADGARSVIERANGLLERHGDLVAEAFRRTNQDMEVALAEKPQGYRVLKDEEAAMVSECVAVLLEQCIDLGEKAQARKLIHRTIAAIGPVNRPWNAALVGCFGGCLIEAGDPEGRALIEQAQQAALAFRDAEARGFVLPVVMLTLAKAGDIDGALAVLKDLPPRARQTALGRVLDGMTKDDHRVPWLDLAGMNIKIGDPSLSPKDPAAARVALPKVAAAARASGDARAEARTLATVALLQARAGDFAGALATARSIPALSWSDFPGPRDGYYEAIKPAALALVAGVQAASDDRAAAAILDEASALARAVGAMDQKLVAQVVIAQQQSASGHQAAARATVAEALPLALLQTEPRRSRVLTMLAEVQVRVGDADDALGTIEAIREYPGLEKARALEVLAAHHEKAGDTAALEKLLHRAAAALESKRPPEAAVSAQVLTVRAFGRETFIDVDLELDESRLTWERERRLQDVRARSGDLEATVRGAQALPAARRDAALSQIAASLARRGDVTRAMDLLASIGSPDVRLRAFATLADAIPERNVRR